MKATPVLGCCFAILAAVACVLVALAGSDGASAKSGREARHTEGQANAPGAPILAIVSLSDQRVSIYDGEGRRILQSPVSSGQTGLETPAGIYSIVQKKEVHQSNVYEDGNMPFMQRITWTGIALHAGVLPGHPASHGCVRMPHAFAQHLFGLTDIGLRVIIARDDIAPAEIEHPALFKPDLRRLELALATPPVSDRPPAVRLGISAPSSEVPLAPGSPRHLQLLRSTADAKSAHASAATKRASEARQLALRKAAEATPAVKALRAAEANAAKAEELLRGAERTLEAARTKATGQSTPETAGSEDAVRAADLAREKASAKVAEAQAQLEATKAQAQARMVAATRADEDAKAAEGARDAALEAAEEAGRKTSPVSVFISRKTQRLYVRQGYVPVFEGPVAIRDADKPIGTFVFTALGYRNAVTDVRWSVVSMYKYSEAMEPVVQPPRKRGDGRGLEAIAADVTAAKAALDRIAIGPDDLERISEVVLPGSSLIISDEGASIETGKDTDFVVVMSGEPQGGLKTRRREPRYRDDDFFGGGRSPFGFFWN
jgi:L,D-transpeptidase catalytic domain